MTTEVTFYAADRRGYFHVVDRDSGEILGSVWRCSRSTWSAAGPDGVALIVGRSGSRDATGRHLLAMLTE